MEEKIYDRQVTKQSLANRVVDQQQIERHFTLNELTQLYMFKPDSKSKSKRSMLAMPQVRMAGGGGWSRLVPLVPRVSQESLSLLRISCWGSCCKSARSRLCLSTSTTPCWTTRRTRS